MKNLPGDILTPSGPAWPLMSCGVPSSSALLASAINLPSLQISSRVCW
jgi:hypothetical protein